MQANTTSSKKLVKYFFPLAALEGLVALFFLLKDPSSEGALLLGYSASRLALAAAALLLTAVLTWAAWQTLTNRPTLPRWQQHTQTWLVEKNILLPLTITLAMAALLSILYHIFCSAPLSLSAEIFLAERPQWMALALRLYAIYARLLPLTLWITALILQTLALWGIHFAPAYRDLHRDGAFGRAAGILLLTGAALFHWTVLLLQLKVFLVIRGWKWYFWQKEIPQPIWLFPLMLAAGLAVVWFVFRNSKHIQRKLIALMLLGAALQIGFGFLAGGGFESLRLKYADSVFNNYAEAAAEGPGLWHALTNYETDYGDDWYLGTKPPGVLAVYILTEKASSIFMPAADSAGRFLSLTTFAAYVFPFLAFLVLLPLYRLARGLKLTEQEGLLAAALYVAVPAVLLIPLFLDQVLYPLIFTSVLLLAQYAWKKKSRTLALLTGLAVYSALYLGFSLLALISLIPLWLGLQTLLHREEHPLKESLKMGLAFGGGLLAAFLLFRLVLNYDILLRYTTAMANHRRAKQYAPGLEQWLHAFLLNHAELLTWYGFPFLLLALTRMIRSLAACIRRQSQPLDELAAAFFLTYGALNLFGQTNGEVQRLWLFMVPMFVLLSAREALHLTRANRGGLSLLFLLQWVTTWLLFTFQDFYG
ncbi:MAG: hypothetical protein RBT34_14855 [Anaerolineaceae bacterium]|jgi:hypothetical protein|nr:hypothetical protein [Anaerolineaceae bacterium]